VTVSEPRKTYEAVFCFESLLDAFLQCRKNKSLRDDVVRFELDLGSRLATLERELCNFTYKIKGYKRFYVFEPKKREIECLPYRDRVVLMALCKNIVEPAFEKVLLDCNAACRKEKGIDYAIFYLENILKNHFKKHGMVGYILKCDISKFFASINHNVLFNLFSRFDFDKNTMDLIQKIIKSHNGDKGCGLPIGNQTSQWWALLALHPIDVLVTKTLGIDYIRYMDDFLLVHHDKRVLLNALAEIEKLLSKLQLKLNNKTQIMPISQGVDFLGFRHRLNNFGIVERPLRQQAQDRLRKHIRELCWLYKNKKVDITYVETHLCCYLAHMLHSKLAILYYKRTISKSPDRDLLREIIRQSTIKLLREKLGKNII